MSEAVAWVAAAYRAADADAAAFVVNARLDMRVRNGRVFGPAVERAQAFADAGTAVCIRSPWPNPA